MITSYRNSDGQLYEAAIDFSSQPPTDILWIDMLAPTPEEKQKIEDWLNIAIPTQDDMVGIEESSRFYKENGSQFLTAPLLHIVEGEKREVAPVTFILNANRLITVRYTTPRAITLFLSRATKPKNGIITTGSDGLTILLGILEATTERLADLLADISTNIEKSSHAIFHSKERNQPMTTVNFRRLLTQVGRQGSFLSMVIESISGISRLLVYTENFANSVNSRKDVELQIESLQRDSQSLEHYADFLSNKMTFLLDTVVGMISTEQNAIIKIFSVAAVGFMPPTLIASIYGMNFHFMPELNEKWGYPLAIIFMIISAIAPLLYFRKKGWL